MSRFDDWELAEERYQLAKLSAKIRRDHARAEGIEVDRVGLLETLKRHRAAYLELYAETYRGWLLRLQEAHRQQLQEIDSAVASFNNAAQDGFVHRPFTLSRPVNTVSDYDVVIEAATRSVEPTFFVKRSEYRELFLDQWRWKEAIMAMHKSYGQRLNFGPVPPSDPIAQGCGAFSDRVSQG